MLDGVIRLRQDLHRYPELSGREGGTARRIIQFFASLNPDSIIEGIGGNGVAVVFSGEKRGPTVLLRSELDALPIAENIETSYCSTVSGISHKCGHDGHMAILAGVGAGLAVKRPPRGKVVLLYQPAEETGEGAAAVLQDPQFAEIRPDYAFALHNLPGFPLGQVVIRHGTFACASRGMTVRLAGTPAHAAQPETGKSPTDAMCRIIQRLSSLPAGLVPAAETAFVTIVGAALGEKTFGIAPGKAEVWATLRSEINDTMAGIVAYAERAVHECASSGGLDVAVDYQEVFPATVNSQHAVDLVRSSVAPESLHDLAKPFRWSEDFGRFTAVSEGALFGLGAGSTMPDLHNPGYDFPDALIPLGVQIFGRIVDACLAGSVAI